MGARRVSSRHSLVLAILLALGLLANACSSADQARTIAATPLNGQDILSLRCGPITLPAAGIDQLNPLDATQTESLNRSTTTTGEAAFYDMFDWRVLDQTTNRVTIVGSDRTGSNDAPVGYATFDTTDTSADWLPTGPSGACTPKLATDTGDPASVVLDPDHEPDPQSTTLHLLINENACASGQAPNDRDITAFETSDTTSVSLVVSVAPFTSANEDASCQGNPWYALAVELSEPIGGRTILDAGSVPAQRLTWPPQGLEESS